MENLFWVVVAFICSQIVMGVWIYTSLDDMKTENTKLRAELSHRLFFRTPQGQISFDVISVLNALLIYNKVKVEGTSGIKIVKQ